MEKEREGVVDGSDQIAKKALDAAEGYRTSFDIFGDESEDEDEDEDDGDCAPATDETPEYWEGYARGLERGFSRAIELLTSRDRN